MFDTSTYAYLYYGLVQTSGDGKSDIYLYDLISLELVSLGQNEIIYTNKVQKTRFIVYEQNVFTTRVYGFSEPA